GMETEGGSHCRGKRSPGPPIGESGAPQAMSRHQGPIIKEPGPRITQFFAIRECAPKPMLPASVVFAGRPSDAGSVDHGGRGQVPTLAASATAWRRSGSYA